MEIVVGHKVNDAAINNLIDCVKELQDEDATLYIGYPIIATADDSFVVPATLVSPKFGFVVFDLPNVGVEPDSAGPEALKNSRDDIYTALYSKMLSYSGLVEKRGLQVPVNVLTYFDVTPMHLRDELDEIVDKDMFADKMNDAKKFDAKYLKPLNAAIERVSSIRPVEKRHNVSREDSYGAKLKKIEKEIANLDFWQKRAAIETPVGPQRIRGLAGSGKTIILALKAAYLHAQNEDWKIIVTFHTQSLYGQFETLISRFYFEDTRGTPDTDFLKIMHSYGSSYKEGFYSAVCKAYGVVPKDFGYAKRTYGYSKAFQGVCAELLSIVKDKPIELFDIVIIDEAQDLPKEFMQLAYWVTKNHCVVFAYDDLQNLSDYQLGSVSEIFNAAVDFSEPDKEPRKDVILPVCYRNTPWALVTAHALGTGIYRSKAAGEDIGLIQHPDDPQLWNDIGYVVDSGELAPGADVVLKRSEDSVPKYFNELLTPDDSVKLCKFEDDVSQLAWVATNIQRDIIEGELLPHDILVVFPDPIVAANRGLLLSQYLEDRGIECHVVGTKYSRDVFSVKGSVAISGPFRAKGNEAAMVYVLDSQYCAQGFGLTKKRNILFTAITRSKAWIRICGFGEGMEVLQSEYKDIAANDYKLKFKVPTNDQLSKIRTQHRDRSAAELNKIKKFRTAMTDMLNSGIDVEDALEEFSEDVRKKIRDALEQSNDL